VPARDRGDVAARERAHFEAIAAAHEGLYWAERAPAAARRREVRGARLVVATALADGRGAGRRILDIGCGTAEYTCEVARRTAAVVVAVDVAPLVVARARPAVPPNVRLGAADVEALPFASGSFDAVLGNAVLHHLRLERTVPELVRVLKPGGRFCFAEPNLLNPQVFLERKVRWLGRWLENSPDEIAFVRWRLARTLAELGLVDVTIRPFDFLYPMTPRPLVAAVERVGRVLERTPLVAEVAGSLLVTARRP
jgi:SAM-dependent methyltransferase